MCDRTEEYKEGYRHGEHMDINSKAYPPKLYNKRQCDEWQQGVTNAICDRLS